VAAVYSAGMPISYTLTPPLCGGFSPPSSRTRLCIRIRLRIRTRLRTAESGQAKGTDDTRASSAEKPPSREVECCLRLLIHNHHLLSHEPGICFAA
jgi:hypothetical protein